MTLTYRTLILLAAGGSLALMLGAWGFQYIGEMPPCKLCYWQRYPHYAAMGLGVLALLLGGALVALLGALAALTTAGIAAYHTGVERGWWEGPSSCTSSGTSGLSTDDLFDQIMAAPLIRCDEVPWEMFGLSMASWNMLASLALVVIWIMAARRA
ncbi:disulfide bond formation protein B [Roseovarius sp. A21]|uniref:Disulfide bond formation protein B n=1 Tax=Roseovarius bejariae TaxID=2576383 RepID=A0A844CWL0_9RHOB|nr:disulfide bond formation protein B [Roseovarius bejariae]MRU14013.1 disulfide bond formation protein B [Roseovarius bejariae]